MDAVQYMPHIELLLQSLRINRDRLTSKSKIAIDARLLRTLLQSLVASTAFDEKFYLRTYPDVAQAVASGSITDPHRHFIEVGFIEGRFGAPPPVDEEYYRATYQDVAAAIANADVISGADHYMRSGAAEGRLPSAELAREVETWRSVLQDDAART